MGEERLSQQRTHVWALVLATTATVVLWQVPQGRYVIYPLTILSTYFHELSHGLCALLLGGRFEELHLFSDGSGYATHSGAVWLGRFGRAMVAAAGPLRPAIAGAILLRMASRSKTPQYLLLGFSAFMLLSLALWVRGMWGMGAVLILSAVAGGAALYTSRAICRFVLQLIALQAGISAWQQFDYLFTKEVVMVGRTMRSDTGIMADQLLLPYWVWGSLLTLAIFALIVSAVLTQLEYSVDVKGGPGDSDKARA